MSDTRFRIVVDVDPTEAKPQIKGLEKSLEDIEAAAKKSSAALAARVDKAIEQEERNAAAARAAAAARVDEIIRQEERAAAAARKATAARIDEMMRQSDAYDDIVKSITDSTHAMQLSGDELKRYNVLQQAMLSAKAQGIQLTEQQKTVLNDEISVHINMANAIKHEREAMRAADDEMQRRKSLLISIIGDEEAQKQKLADLAHLYATGALSAEKYAKAQKDALGQSGPGLGSKAKDFASQLPGGGLIGLGAVGVGAAAVTGVVALGGEYINLSNAAQKFTSASQDVNAVIAEQFDLSKKLHSSLGDTMELYDSIRDATDELNMSHEQQIQLTKSVGAAVVGSGKSLGEAGQLLAKLTYAISAGSISALELKGIFKQFPDVAAGFVEVTGKSRKEMIALAADGKFTGDMLVNAFNAIGPAMEDKVSKKALTAGQSFARFKDELTISVGAMVTSTGAFEALASVLEATAYVIVGVAVGLKAIGDAAVATINAIDDAVVAVGQFASDTASMVSDAVTGLVGGIDLTQESLKRLVEAQKEAADTTSWYSDATTEALAVVDKHGVSVSTTTTATVKLTAEEEKLAQAMRDADPAIGGATKMLDDQARSIKAVHDRVIALRAALNSGTLGGAGENLVKRSALDLEYQKAKIAETFADKSYGEVVVRVKAAELDRAAAIEKVTTAYKVGAITAKQYYAEMAQYRSSGGGKKKTDVEDSIGNSMGEALKREQEATRARIKLLSDYDAAVAASVSAAEGKNMNDQLDAAAESLKKMQQELESVGKSFKEAAPSEEWTKAITEIAKPALTDALTQMGDAFIEFARTGKGSFSDMVDSILANLQRLLLNKLIMQLVDSIFPTKVPGVPTAGGAVAGIISGALGAGGAGGASGGASGGTGGGGSSARRRGGGNAPIIRLYNITDPNAPINAIASSGGEQAVMRVMAKNANTVRNLTRR